MNGLKEDLVLLITMVVDAHLKVFGDLYLLQ